MKGRTAGQQISSGIGVTSLIVTEPGTQSVGETAGRNKAGSLGEPCAIHMEFLSKPKAVLKMQSLKKM